MDSTRKNNQSEPIRKVTIIPNGFQPQYVTNLVNSVAPGLEELNFLGGDIYQTSQFKKNVIIKNIRGSHSAQSLTLEKLNRALKYYLKMILYLFRTESKVVHVLWVRFYFWDGIVINSILKLLGKKLIYTAHNFLPHNRDNAYQRFVHYFLYRIVDKIVVHSESLKSRLVNEFAIDEQKIKVIKHGVYDIKHSPGITKESARKFINIESSKRVILFFGNISRYKGLTQLIEAFNKCRLSNPFLTLIIAGKLEPEYQSEFEKIIKGVCLDHVILHAEFISEEKVEIYFKSADVIVLPYLEGSQSGVLFLAYSYGRPVIAPDIGNFINDIVVGKTGLIFSKGNGQDLASKIEEVFSSSTFLDNKLEDSIKQFAHSNYSWNKIGIDLLQIYIESAE
jgi:D-inositol-3-phosphate glycosyltransferase